jgi:hypothetical protein
VGRKNDNIMRMTKGRAVALAILALESQSEATRGSYPTTVSRELVAARDYIRNNWSNWPSTRRGGAKQRS